MKLRDNRFCCFYGCRNRLFKVWPFCQQHMRQRCGVQVQKSRISKAGYGVFATRPFKQGEKILEYYGENLTKEQFDKRYGNELGTYVLQVNKNLYIDASGFQSSVAKFVNDPKNSGKKANCRFSVWRGGAWIVAKKNINASREMPIELLVSYGPVYWQ